LRLSKKKKGKRDNARREKGGGKGMGEGGQCLCRKNSCYPTSVKVLGGTLKVEKERGFRGESNRKGWMSSEKTDFDKKERKVKTVVPSSQKLCRVKWERASTLRFAGVNQEGIYRERNKSVPASW